MYPRALSDFTGPSRESGTQIVYQYCPVCGSQSWKLYVNPVTGQWYCFAEQHGKGGKVGSVTPSSAALTQALQDLDRPQRGPWPEIELPPWKGLSATAMTYLVSRGVDLHTARWLGLCEAVDERRLLIPFYGVGRTIIYYQGRALDGSQPKYKGPPGARPLYVLPSWKSTDVLWIVEGVFDAILLWSALKQPVCALGGTSLSARNERDLRDLIRRKPSVQNEGSGTNHVGSRVCAAGTATTTAVCAQSVGAGTIQPHQLVPSSRPPVINLLLDNDIAGWRGTVRLGELLRDTASIQVHTNRLSGKDPAEQRDWGWAREVSP